MFANASPQVGLWRDGNPSSWVGGDAKWASWATSSWIPCRQLGGVEPCYHGGEIVRAANEAFSERN